MGIKLEYILIVLLVITIYVTTTINLVSSARKNIDSPKELEFINTTFIEANTEKRLSTLYTPHGVRQNSILILDNLKYNTENIKKLLANKGTYKGKILYLDGNVSLREISGNLYLTEHANYDQENEILRITSPFTGYMVRNIYKGNTLIYDVKTKEINATNVDSIIYTTNK